MSDISAFVGCTIISKNYLSHARVLAESFHRHHPGSRFFVLLADKLDGRFDPAQEQFTLVHLEDLAIPDVHRMAFQYSILEFNTAVKPFFLEYLLKNEHCEHLAYFDPDILIFQPLTAIADVLQMHDIVLIPHITKPIEDDKRPSERDILISGTYNLGFIAMRPSADVFSFLQWWGERLRTLCYTRPRDGLFVDQKWIDLVPGMVPRTALLREPGFNVAHWNLHERQLETDGAGYTVNGKPLYFFHFSGFNPRRPDRLSSHQTRTELRNNPVLAGLCTDYAALHKKHGFDRTHILPYAFDHFDNGIPVTPFLRTLYAAGQKEHFGNPLQTQHSRSFFAWLNSKAYATGGEGFLSRLQYAIYKNRPDVHNRFSNLRSRKEQIAFAKWLLEPAQREAYRLDRHFTKSLEPLAALVYRSPKQRFGDAWLHLRSTLRTIRLYRHRFEPYQQFIRWLKRTIGEHAFYAIKTKPQIALPMPEPYREERRRELGLNIAGYFQGEMGVGEAARGHARAAKAAGIPCAMNNVGDCPARKEDHSFDAEFQPDNPHRVNLIEVNADRLADFCLERGPAYFDEKYSIGHWAWELSRFPEKWSEQFSYLQEVWTASSFIAESVAARSPLPVLRMPYSIDIPRPSARSREELGLPPEGFIFLFIFDFYSVFERKNPLAVVRAFEAAFSGEDRAHLVLKCTNGDAFPAQKERLLHACRHPRITVKDGYASRQDMIDLLNLSDAYVSLHRAEGFGLTMAEAMALGKPVIGTNYSGNTDFMTADNSFPVRFTLKELEENYGPYEQGNVWADPDPIDAARQMKRIYDDPVAAHSKALRGKQTIEEQFSPKAVGGLLRKRLEVIQGFTF